MRHDFMKVKKIFVFLLLIAISSVFFAQSTNSSAGYFTSEYGGFEVITLKKVSDNYFMAFTNTEADRFYKKLKRRHIKILKNIRGIRCHGDGVSGVSDKRGRTFFCHMTRPQLSNCRILVDVPLTSK